jgi:hypothetical protein
MMSGGGVRVSSRILSISPRPISKLYTHSISPAISEPKPSNKPHKTKAHTLRYTNSYYRTGYCHLLLDWSAEERAVVAEVIEICGFVS